jgi:hypothetical protein
MTALFHFTGSLLSITGQREKTPMYVWRVQFPPNPTEEGSVKQQGQP